LKLRLKRWRVYVEALDIFTKLGFPVALSVYLLWRNEARQVAVERAIRQQNKMLVLVFGRLGIGIRDEKEDPE